MTAEGREQACPVCTVGHIQATCDHHKDVLCPSCSPSITMPLDPFDPVVIAPGVAAIPLTPAPWDDLPDGQHAVTPDGSVWQRRKGLWHRDPWWQGLVAREIVAVCAEPDEWAFGLGWTRKHVEEHVGPLTPITLPKEPSDG